MAMRILSALAMSFFVPAAAGAACEARSGPQTAALVELYTSEGCSSCPPADRWLAKLATTAPTAVPIAFHVDYWDGLGWPDRFAQQRFTPRPESDPAKMAVVAFVQDVKTGEVLQALSAPLCR